MTDELKLRASAIPPGESAVVAFDGEQVAVFNIDGVFYACSDACPHAGGPLHQGFVEGTDVVCPWHGWRFDMNTDVPHPKDGVYRYRVTVVDDEIHLARVA